MAVAVEQVPGVVAAVVAVAAVVVAVVVVAVVAVVVVVVVSAVAVAVVERMVVGEGGVLVLASLVPLLPLAAEPALHGGPPPETPSMPPSYPHRCRRRGRHLSAAGTRSCVAEFALPPALAHCTAAPSPAHPW